MSNHGGLRVGAGRPLGAMNQTSKAIRSLVEDETGGIPLPVLVCKWAIELANCGDKAGAAKLMALSMAFAYPKPGSEPKPPNDAMIALGAAMFPPPLPPPDDGAAFTVSE